MILMDGYRDGMLSRTTMISGAGGCKASEQWCDGPWAKSPCTRARAGARRARAKQRMRRFCEFHATKEVATCDTWETIERWKPLYDDLKGACDEGKPT